MEYYSTIKEWNNALCSDIDANIDYHTKWSKWERERQIPYDITFMWNLKYGTNEFIYQAEKTHKHNRISASKGHGECRREGIGV